MTDKLTGLGAITSCTSYVVEHERHHWTEDSENLLDAINSSHIFNDAVEAELILDRQLDNAEPPTQLDLVQALVDHYLEASGLDYIHECHEECKEGAEAYLCQDDGWHIYLKVDSSEILIEARYGQHSLVLGLDSEDKLEASVSAMETFIGEYVANGYRMEEE